MIRPPREESWFGLAIGAGEHPTRTRERMVATMAMGRRRRVCDAADPRCHIWHHVCPPGQRFSIAARPHSGFSERDLDHELDKCPRPCANCHARVHYEARTAERKWGPVEIIHVAGETELVLYRTPAGAEVRVKYRQ
jgi:hypothetical protein